MNEMYKRIEALCKEAGVNITKMCRDADVPRGALTDLKMGRTKNLGAASISKISSYFGVAADYLLGTEENKKTASQPGDGNEIEFIKLFQKLSPEEQIRELSYLRELVDRKGM